MADIVELQIKIDQLREAERGLADLKKEMDSLKKEKLRIQVERHDWTAFQHDLEKALTAAKSRLEELKADLKDFQDRGKSQGFIDFKTEKIEAAEREIEKLTNDIGYAKELSRGLGDEYNSVKDRIEQAKAPLQEAKDDVRQLTSEVKEQEQGLIRLSKEAEKNAKEEEKKAEAAEKTAEAQRRQEEREQAAIEKKLEAEQREREKEEKARATAEAIAKQRAEEEAVAEAARQVEERFQAGLAVIDAMSSALNGVANIIGGINNFASGIFDSFEYSSNLFNFSAIEKALDTITSMVTQNITGNLDRITSRYDILNTFDDYMKLMGVSQEAADNAVSRINESILGLPIGLDEAMYRLRRYQMFMGDIDQATNFTIGLQRAIMAGGATEQMRNMSYNQIERLLSTGELTTKRQWISLLTGLGVSSQFIAEQLGYEGWGGKELAAALYQNNISVDEFLGAITELGKGTSEAAKRLNEALNIYKGTIESWASNIEFAFIRGGANTLGTIDAVLQIETDVSVVGYMEKVRNAVNDAFSDIQSWIKSNPEAFTLNIDALDNLRTSLGKFDIGHIAKRGYRYIADFINSIATGLEKLNHSRLENFVAFGATIAGPIASIAKQAGPFGIALGVVDRFKNFNWSNLFGKIATNVDRIADAISKLLNLIPDDLMSDLLAFGVTYGPLVYSALITIANGLKAVKGALEWMWEMGVVSTVGGGLGVLAGGIAAVAAALGALYLVYDTKRDLHTQLGFDELDADIRQAQTLHDSINTITNSYEESIGSADAKAETAQTLLDKIDKLNKVVQRTGNSNVARELQTYVELANDLFPELALGIDEATGALDEHSEAVLENRDAYIEMLTAMSKYEAAQTALRSLYSEQFRLKGVKQDLENDLEIAEAVYDAYREGQDERAELIAKYGHPGSYYTPPVGLTEAEKEVNSLREQLQQTNDDLTENEKNIRYVEDALKDTLKEVTNAKNALDGVDESVNLEALQTSTQYFLELAAAEDEAASSAQDYSDTVAEVAERSDEEIQAVENFGDALNNLIDSFNNAKEAARSTIDSLVSGFEKIEDIDPFSFKDASEGLDSQLAFLDKYLDAETAILDYMLNGNISEAERAMLGTIVANGDPSELFAFSEALGTEQYEELMGKMLDVEAAKEAASKVGGEIGAVVSEGIQNGILSSLAADGYLSPEMQQYMDRWTTLLQHGMSDSDAIKAFRKGIASGDDVLVNGMVDAYATRYAETVSDLIAKMLEQGVPEDQIPLDEIKERAGRLAHRFENNWMTNLMVPDSGTTEQLASTTENLRKMFFQEGDDSGEESVGGAVNVLNGLLVSLYEDTYKNLTDSTNQLADTFDTFVQSHLTEVTNAYGDASESADSLETETDEVGTKADEVGPKMSTLAEKIGEVDTAANYAATSISNATAELNALSQAIDAINGKELNIPGVASIPNASASFGGQPSYRDRYATGGEVEGTYLGYDSVPAVLTPGEFVIQRSAARALGSNFLYGLNSMNLQSAFAPMMGSLLGGGIGSMAETFVGSDFVELFGTFVEQLGEISTKLIDLNTYAGNANSAIDGLNTAINDTNSAATNAHSPVDTLVTDISCLGEEAFTAETFVYNLFTSTQELGVQASNATLYVNGLASALGNFIDKNFEYNIDGSGPSEPIFMASGGSVNGHYIGVDNVPAMLMPGEFVLRRKAVQKLGKNFLQNLNSMNIPAAVESLMRGVNIPMGHGIVAYDNRRTYDNHATVNQNIVTNNPAFTYRRASRFVGAL